MVGLGPFVCCLRQGHGQLPYQAMALGQGDESAFQSIRRSGAWESPARPEGMQVSHFPVDPGGSAQGTSPGALYQQALRE